MHREEIELRLKAELCEAQRQMRGITLDELIEGYLRVLREFKAALALEKAPQEPAVETAGGTQAITPREREVLALIASGKSSKQIAAELGIAFRTALCHRNRIYQKLNVHTNVELTRVAMRMGFVEL